MKLQKNLLSLICYWTSVIQLQNVTSITCLPLSYDSPPPTVTWIPTLRSQFWFDAHCNMHRTTSIQTPKLATLWWLLFDWQFKVVLKSRLAVWNLDFSLVFATREWLRYTRSLDPWETWRHTTFWWIDAGPAESPIMDLRDLRNRIRTRLASQLCRTKTNTKVCGLLPFRYMTHFFLASQGKKTVKQPHWIYWRRSNNPIGSDRFLIPGRWRCSLEVDSLNPFC